MTQIFLYIHVLYAYIFILVCSSVLEHHIEQILDLFHKWFSICTCVYVILNSTNYQLNHLIQYWHFHLGEKKIKSQVPVNSFTFFFSKLQVYSCRYCYTTNDKHLTYLEK